ncbi:hypothetical protein AAMO2058_001179400 [Amorphochlora amoebiformis]
MLLPDIYRKLFTDIGYDMDSFFKIQRVMPAFRAIFSDNISVTFSDDQADMQRQLNALEIDGFQKYQSYMKWADTNLDAGLPLFIQQDLASGAPKLPEFLFNCLRYWPLFSHHKQLGQFFDTDRMKALMSFQDLYIGLSPYEAPAVFSLLQSIEYTRGIYYPIGGFSKISQALIQVCEENGVEIQYDSPVSRILVNAENNKAMGIEINEKTNVKADIIIANPDLCYSELNLLKPQEQRQGFKELEKTLKHSSSVISICWATRKRFDTLCHHSVFLSTNYEKSWEGIFTWEDFGKSLTDCQKSYKDFNFYVHAPSRTDPSACPEGHDSIMVLVPSPPVDESLSLEEARERERRVKFEVREAVIQRFEDAGMKDFRSHIVGESIRTPTQWREKYNLRRGSVFGLAHPMQQLSLFRPQPKHPTIRDLYFVGASTTPGNGVPLVLVGAEQVAEQIERDQDTCPKTQSRSREVT